MQSLKKPPSLPNWLDKFPRFLCILGFVFIYLFGCAALVPQVSAASLGMPGGRVSDPVVRQVDIARPAVVRIITTLKASLTVHLTATSAPTFPLDGSSYPIELSGSGAFISAHGDILTADHVVNPPHDQGLNDALYQEAAQDIADYINSHFQVNQPFTPNDVVAELETGAFPSTPTYQPPTSEVYLSTDYSGPVNAAKFSQIPSSNRAAVDRIEAQSSFEAMDVAIIHVSGMDDMPSIQLDDSSQVEELDNLTIIGYPGLGDVSVSPTNLLTSSVNRIYVSAMKTTDSGAPVIQVGGNVEHGDSGAPALDDSGRIVGIVSFGIFDPNESGQTSFLQASNSAKTLLQTGGIDTAPGPFERAWTQAFNDYASTAAGHWHKAAQEFQSLENTYKGFLGVTSYLSYSQDQASHEQSPASTTASPTTVLIVVLVLLALVVFALLFFVIARRRSRPALAGVSQFPPSPFGTYPPLQTGVAGGYSQTAGSYSAPTYPAQAGSFSGVYPPTPESYGAPAVFPQASESYPPDPASYASATWSEQPVNPLPQTPLPTVSETPLPATPAQAESIPEREAVSSAPTLSESSLATPAPVSASVFERSLPTWAPPASQPDPLANREQPQAVAKSELPFARPFLPSENAWPAVTTSEEERAASAALRAFSVPRRPSNPLAEGQGAAPEDRSAGVHLILTPCGHTNASDVRFCRICGQAILPNDASGSAMPGAF